MSDEKIGIFAALWRWISFYKSRKALGLVRAADRQFTGSTGGISDAFDLHQNKIVTQFRELRGAVAQVESVIEQDRQELERLNKEEGELLRKRDGAMNLFEQAQTAGNQKEITDGVTIPAVDITVGEDEFLANEYIEYSTLKGDLDYAGRWKKKGKFDFSSTLVTQTDFVNFRVLP